MISNIIAGVIVFILILLAVRSYIRERKSGCGGCNGCKTNCKKGNRLL